MDTSDTARAAEPAADPLAAPTLTLPKGGGAIRGIGETFTANAVTGTACLSVPVATSPGRSGFGPQLALTYDSGAGNGPYGFGWQLCAPEITRRTDKGLPRYLDEEESDIFILSGAEDLVPELSLINGDWQRVSFDSPADQPGYRVQRYRPRTEGLFARIERWTERCSGISHWRTISKDNVTTLYGTHADARIADPADPTRIFSWLIAESRDDSGNLMLYRYKPEDGAQAGAHAPCAICPRTGGAYLKSGTNSRPPGPECSAAIRMTRRGALWILISRAPCFPGFPVGRISR